MLYIFTFNIKYTLSIYCVYIVCIPHDVYKLSCVVPTLRHVVPFVKLVVLSYQVF